MDLDKVIDKLYKERLKLDRVIAAMEELRKPGAQHAGAPKKRRGRKSLDEKGREEVSARMKKYWASRRKVDGNDQSLKEGEGLAPEATRPLS